MRKAAMLAGLLLGAVVLVACGGGGTRPATPSPSTTPVATTPAEPSTSPAASATAEPSPSMVPDLWPAPWDSGIAAGWAWLTLAGDQLFVSVAAPYDCCDNFSTGPGVVAALDPATGNEQWRLDTPSQAFPPVMVGETLVVGTSDGTVYGLDPASGDQRWSMAFPGIPFQVVDADGIAIVGDADPEHPWGPNGIADKMRIRGHAWAIDANDGTVRWQIETGTFGVFLATDGEQVYVTNADLNSEGFMVALDPATGDERWRVVAGPATSPPAIGDGLVVAGEATGNLIAYEAATGNVAWTAGPESGSGVIVSPVIRDGVLVAPTNTHTIDLRDAAAGAFLASGQFADCGALPVDAEDEAAYIYCSRLAGIDLLARGDRAIVFVPILLDDIQVNDAVVRDRVVYLAVQDGDAPVIVRAVERP